MSRMLIGFEAVRGLEADEHTAVGCRENFYCLSSKIWDKTSEYHKISEPAAGDSHMRFHLIDLCPHKIVFLLCGMPGWHALQLPDTCSADKAAEEWEKKIHSSSQEQF